jgi:hypothetical protein
MNRKFHQRITKIGKYIALANVLLMQTVKNEDERQACGMIYFTITTENRL